MFCNVCFALQFLAANLFGNIQLPIIDFKIIVGEHK